LMLDLSKIVFASGISLLAVFVTYNCIPSISSFAYLIVCLLFGGAMFYVSGIFLKIDELLFLQNKIIKLVHHK
jgi:uncharacterized membrane protein YqhA